MPFAQFFKRENPASSVLRPFPVEEGGMLPGKWFDCLGITRSVV